MTCSISAAPRRRLREALIHGRVSGQASSSSRVVESSHHNHHLLLLLWANGKFLAGAGTQILG